MLPRQKLAVQKLAVPKLAVQKLAVPKLAVQKQLLPLGPKQLGLKIYMKSFYRNCSRPA